MGRSETHDIGPAYSGLKEVSDRQRFGILKLARNSREIQTSGEKNSPGLEAVVIPLLAWVRDPENDSTAVTLMWQCRGSDTAVPSFTGPLTVELSSWAVNNVLY